MRELPPSEERVLIWEYKGTTIYSEPFNGDTIFIAENEFEIIRFYPDGSRSYTHRNSGDVVTYYPDNTFTQEIPGEPIIYGKTRFNVTEDPQP